MRYVVTFRDENGRWYWEGGYCWSFYRQVAKPLTLTQACNLRDKMQKDKGREDHFTIKKLPRRNHEKRRNIRRDFIHRVSGYAGR